MRRPRTETIRRLEPVAELRQQSQDEHDIAEFTTGRANIQRERELRAENGGCGRSWVVRKSKPTTRKRGSRYREQRRVRRQRRGLRTGISREPPALMRR